jgi:hypothetical protein
MMDLKKKGYEDLDRIQLAQERVQCWSLMSTIIAVQVA